MVLPTILTLSAQDLVIAKAANDRLAPYLENSGTEAQNSHRNPNDNNTSASNTSVKGTRAKDAHVKDARVKDLGTYGETFPIHEQSLLEVIKAKLQDLAQTGKLAAHQETILKKAKEQFNRPSAVRGIQKTVNPKSLAYDPSITVPYDLKDHEEKIFHKKGTTVNPLDTHAFQHPFLFVDGDDPEQVAWAIRQHQQADPSHKPKIVLVQGAPFEVSKRWGLPIYFDQSGVLVKKFGITQVPAKVSQKGKILLVDEVEIRK